ncbi:MAG: DASS family sodium-coupled anion symporter [Planctomycetota bacterium]
MLAGAVLGFGNLGPPGFTVLALAAWMVCWWLTEAVDVAVTALLPLVVLPLGTADAASSASAALAAAAEPYAHPNIALYLGGFVLGLAMEHTGLHKRSALAVLSAIGSRPGSVVAGFMGVTAFLSMWISNTATAVMMLPIAMSVAAVFDRKGDPDSNDTAKCLLLAVAYSASVGGIGTLIGTPPNIQLAAFVEERYGTPIGFAQWLKVGLPLVVIFLPLTWLIMTRVVYRLPRTAEEGVRDAIARERAALGPMTRDERFVLAVFLATAILWITRAQLASIEIAGAQPLAGLTDAGIAMLAAIVLFATPLSLRHPRTAARWQDTARLPWGVLILFGGGLSLARAIDAHGVADLIAEQTSALGGLPLIAIIAAITAGVIFLTELTSNTATVATLLPVLAGVAVSIDAEPMSLLVPATLAASCAFMMPAATPPNAVVFSSGRLTVPMMCRAGLLLNIAGIAIVTLLSWVVVMHVFTPAVPAAGSLPE